MVWWWTENPSETCRASYRNKWIEKSRILLVVLRECYMKVLFFYLSTTIANELSGHDANWMEMWKIHINDVLNKLIVICFIIRKLVHILSIETLQGAYFAHFHSLIKFWILFWCSSTTKNILRTMLGIFPRCFCKGWFVKLHILPVRSLCSFSLIMFLINNVDIFKANLPLHNFNTRSKNQLHFLSVKLTSVKKMFHLFCYKNI